MYINQRSHHYKNIQFSKSILYANDYPSVIVEKYVKKCLQKINNSSLNINNNNNNNYRIEYNKLPKIRIPFKKPIYNKLSNICHRFGFIPIAQMRDKLSCVIKRGKDTTKTLDKPNVVYKLKCDTCTASYIGETKRALMFRVEEHKRDIENRNNKKVVPMHCNNGHKINPEKASILNVEINTNKRLISEMSNINLQETSINLKEDTQKLHDNYESVIHNLSRYDKLCVSNAHE